MGLLRQCWHPPLREGEELSSLRTGSGTVCWAAHGSTHTETPMLENFFCAPKTLRRLRTGPSGRYIDGFATELARAGYRVRVPSVISRAAAHLGLFMHRTRADLRPSTRALWRRSPPLPPLPMFPTRTATNGLPRRLRSEALSTVSSLSSICAAAMSRRARVDEPALVTAFRDWLQAHRGASNPTVRLYARDATELVKALGEDVSTWTVRAVRDFVTRPRSSMRRWNHPEANHVACVRSYGS